LTGPDRILIVDAHPDPSPERYARALVRAYRDGAVRAGRSVEVLELHRMDIPFLRSPSAWREIEPPADIQLAMAAITRCVHLVLIYPLWLGSMPALAKAFFEQVARPGFAIDEAKLGLHPGLLGGRSVRIIVTMGMPALVYRWYFSAHSLKALERNILAFCGFGPIRHTLIGNIEGIGDAARRRWLEKVEALGEAGS
jgi:putative NADPH-quinone reductase